MSKRIVPDRLRMEAYLNLGLNNSEIARQYEKDTGIRVTPQAISMAITRYGLKTNNPRSRYEDLIPWQLRPEHRMHTEARLLRMEARRRLGKSLSAADLTWLNNWMKLLRDSNAVVTYDPDREEGFYWVERKPTDRDIIRMPEQESAA